MGLRGLLRATRAFCLAQLFAFSSQALAIDFFNSGIDYWGNAAVPNWHPEDTPPPTSFRWETHLDPSSDEFFREGDHLPPRPLMKVARNPSNENIRNWLTLIERKNQIMERLQRRMVEFGAAQGVSTPTNSIAPVEAPRTTSGHLDPTRFRLRLYFDSNCPHCHNMLGTLAELRDHGFDVEVRQVDADARAAAMLPFSVSPVSAGELAEHGVASVPVLLIADLDRHRVYRINGYHSFASVMSVLRNRPA